MGDEAVLVGEFEDIRGIDRLAAELA